MASEEEMTRHVRIVLRPYASALPLGCFAFGIGNALYASYLLHWVPGSETRLLALMLLVFVAPLELIACGMAFLSRDTGAATAMGIFAMAWVAQGVGLLLFRQGPSVLTGILLAMLALVLLLLMAVTFRGKPLISIVLVFAMLHSAAAAGTKFGGGAGFSVAAAVAGFCIVVSAFYCGFALLLEDVQGKLLPLTGRKGAAQEAMGVAWRTR